MFRVRSLLNRGRRLVAPASLKGADKLHLGAGFRQMDGWANIDLSGNNIIWDLTKPLPIKPGSVRFAYSEHFIEHVTKKQALDVLTNARAVLAPNAVIRISTPDLMVWAEHYVAGRLVGVPSHEWNPATLCDMLNETFHNWGHQYLYDEPELAAMLGKAGFKSIRRVKWRESDHAELRGLETRPDMGDLILEAT